MSDNREAEGAGGAGNRPAAAPATPPGGAAREFLAKIEQALEDLVTLKVVTLVGPVAVTGTGTEARVTITGAGATEAASTEVDLLRGDITNTFSTGFSALANGEMRSFHQTQVEQSQSIVTGNFAELQKLATALLGAVRR
jgi:hypothetical protein